MGNYMKLLLNRDLIMEQIDEYFENNGVKCKINDPIIINESTGQTRYIINADKEEIKIDFFFRSDKTTTIQPTGSLKSKEVGAKIAKYIIEQNNCYEVKKGTATIENISEEKFNHLKLYLNDVEGIEVLDENDNANGCGQLYQIVSQIGDKITLTYYKKSGKLVFQGTLFKIYLEITCFLTGLGFKLEQEVNGEKVENDNVENIVKKMLPNSYDKIDRIFIDFIHDSYIQIESKIKYRDYSICTFSSLKGLEGFIKQILLKNGIRLNDKLGFSIKDSNGEIKPIFINTASGHILNEDLVTGVDSLNKIGLEETYRFYYKHRHTLFHTKQVLCATRRITDKAIAEKIVVDVCELFEKHYQLIV